MEGEKRVCVSVCVSVIVCPCVCVGMCVRVCQNGIFILATTVQDNMSEQLCNVYQLSLSLMLLA